MRADLRSEYFTHAKCTKCGHLSTVDKFDMTETPLNLGTTETADAVWTLLEISEGTKLSTYSGTCPICRCHFVEFLYGSEIN